MEKDKLRMGGKGSAHLAKRELAVKGPEGAPQNYYAMR
jgi:hypothetical protein